MQYKVLLPPILCLLPHSDLDRKWWEPPHAWNCTEQEESSCWIHLCITLFSNVQWHHLQMYLKNTFNKMCSEEKKNTNIFLSFMLGALGHKGHEILNLMAFTGKHNFTSHLPRTVHGSLKLCSGDYIHTFQSYSAPGAGRSLSKQ